VESLFFYCYLTGSDAKEALLGHHQANRLIKSGSAFIHIRRRGKDVVVPILNEWERLMWSKITNLQYPEVRFDVVEPFGKMPYTHYIKQMDEIVRILCRRNGLKHEKRTISQFLRPVRAYALLETGYDLEYIKYLFNFKDDVFIRQRAYSWLGYSSIYESKIEEELPDMPTITREQLDAL
jgi:hypothetical protein